jgi:hypothetical protein
LRFAFFVTMRAYRMAWSVILQKPLTPYPIRRICMLLGFSRSARCILTCAGYSASSIVTTSVRTMA